MQLTAKKDGKDSFEVDGKKYKTERFGRGMKEQLLVLRKW